MKRKMLQFLGLLATNAVVEGLLLLALVLDLSRGDVILSSLPLLVAVPALVAQPWFVGFFLLPQGYMLAPLLTTAVSVPLYTFLNRWGKLDRAKRALGRLRGKRTTFIGIVALAVLTGVGYARHIDFPALRHDIPPVLREGAHALEFQDADAKLYCLESFIDSSWVWQAELSEASVNRIAGNLSMHRIPADQVGRDFLHMPPYWWRPVLSKAAWDLSTTNFPMTNRGPDGLHALATWNPGDRLLHLWVKENF